MALFDVINMIYMPFKLKEGVKRRGYIRGGVELFKNVVGLEIKHINSH